MSFHHRPFLASEVALAIGGYTNPADLLSADLFFEVILSKFAIMCDPTSEFLLFFLGESDGI